MGSQDEPGAYGGFPPLCGRFCPIEHTEDAIFFGEDSPNRVSAINLERLKFTKMQKPNHRVNVGAGQ